MSFALPLLLALSVAPAGAPDDDDDDARWYAWPMAAGGVVADPNAFGGGPQLALSWRPWSFLEPEIIVGAGAFGGTDQYTNRFSFGTRLVLPSDTIEPFAWLAFSHFHETDFEAFVAHPVEAILTLSEVGVSHRMGPEAGIGVVLPIAVQRWDDGDPLRVVLRGSAMYLPDLDGLGVDGLGDDSHLYLLFEVGVGLPLRFDPEALQEPRVHVPFSTTRS